MTDEKRAEIERQARCFLHPILRGSEADRAVAYILAWEEANPDAEAHVRADAWYRIELLAA